MKEFPCLSNVSERKFSTDFKAPDENIKTYGSHQLNGSLALDEQMHLLPRYLLWITFAVISSSLFFQYDLMNKV